MRVLKTYKSKVVIQFCVFVGSLFGPFGPAITTATITTATITGFVHTQLKGWFPYDRRSQIAIRSAIVCDHMETTSAIVCDPAIVIAEDRTMFYLKAGFHMIADRRSQTIAIDRRRSQEIEHGSIFCDRLRSRSQDRRRSQK